jgi:hypothetical protein
MIDILRGEDPAADVEVDEFRFRAMVEARMGAALDGAWDPVAKAANLTEALDRFDVTGPFVLVANGDGVHSTHVFAAGRTDIAAVVLVDPIPLGFQDFFDSAYPDASDHPSWLDLDHDVSDSLGDLGNVPLVLATRAHDPDTGFLSPQFVEGAGLAAAVAIDDFWSSGMAYYEGLSRNSTRIAVQSMWQYILWFDRETVVRTVRSVLPPS